MCTCFYASVHAPQVFLKSNVYLHSVRMHIVHNVFVCVCAGVHDGRTGEGGSDGAASVT